MTALEVESSFFTKAKDSIHIDRPAIVVAPQTEEGHPGRSGEILVETSAGHQTDSALLTEFHGGHQRTLPKVLRRSGQRGGVHVIVKRVVGDDVDHAAGGVEAE